MESAFVDGVLTIRLQGQITFQTVNSVQDVLARSLHDPALRVVEFDLREVDFIDSAGLSVLAMPRKSRPIPRGVRLLVTHNSQPDRVVRLARFDLMMEIVRMPSNSAATA